MSGTKHFVTADTVAIDATGAVFETNIEQSILCSLNIDSTEAATYALDVSPDGDAYFTAEETYSGSDVRDVFELTDRHIRLRVTSTASSGSTADITVQGLR